MRFLIPLVALACSAAGADLPTILGAGRAGPDLAQVPAGHLRDELAGLAPAARAAALLGLAGTPVADVGELSVDRTGGLFYRCSFGVAARPAPAHPHPTALAIAPAAPVYHSRPGSAKVIYLCFIGGVVTGTQWNVSAGASSWTCLPFSRDADYTTFSTAEQDEIADIWRRVSEDYAPFDVDVTTAPPTTWNDQTAWAMVTETTDANGLSLPHAGAGGVAYVNVFGGTGFHSTYSPAWVTDQSGSDIIAEATSHEIGHNLGLHHDGLTASAPGGAQAYYGGHGATPTSPSWGPIMGTGYDQNVSQWSKGEYFAANNTEDDLAIIAGKLSYLPDDHGGTAATATALPLVGGSFSISGVIEQTGDVDAFQVVVGSGPFTATVAPLHLPTATWGGDLDAALELRDAAFTPVITTNPPGSTNASISTTLTAGTYYLVVSPSGAGSPLANPPSGYTSYASLGRYSLSGTGLVPGPSLGVKGGGVGIIDGDSTPSTVDGTDFGKVLLGGSTSHTFTLANAGSQALHLGGSPVIAVTGDAAFTVQAANATTLASGASIDVGVTFTSSIPGLHTAVATIANDDPAHPAFSFTITGQGNRAPTIGQPSVVLPSSASQTLDFSSLVAITGAADPDGDPLSLRIESVDRGSLTLNGVAVVPGSTLISAGDTVLWTIPSLNAGLIPAFQLRATDGAAFSPAVALLVPGPPPVISSATSVTAPIGLPFSYLVTATNGPTAFSATGLPAPLAIDPVNGRISGVPTATGAFPVTITATNTSGTGQATVTFTFTTTDGTTQVSGASSSGAGQSGGGCGTGGGLAVLTAGAAALLVARRRRPPRMPG